MASLFLADRMDLLGCIDLEENQKADNHDFHKWCEKMYLNNTLTDTTTPIGTIQSSFVNNGLCFNEYIICQGNQPFLWREHYTNMVNAVRALGMNHDEFPTSRELERKIQVLCQKNHYPPYSLFKIIIWTQTDNLKLRFAILQERLKGNPYDYIEGKLFLSVYHDIPMYPSSISWIDMPNALFAMAKSSARKKECDEACIIDNKGRIVTTTVGNIYLLTGNDIIGVNYNDGARKDAIEESLEKAAKTLNYTLKYVPGITIEQLNKARECIIASSALGIRSVDGCDTKRFFKADGAKIALKLHDLFVF